jgi:hypothetical protein
MSNADFELRWTERNGEFLTTWVSDRGNESISVVRDAHGWHCETSDGRHSSPFATVEEAKAAAQALFTSERNADVVRDFVQRRAAMKR